MFLTLLLGLLVAYAQAGDKCITPNGETAECIPLKSCPILENAMNNPNAYSFLEQSACGSRIDDTLVCCGTSANFNEDPDTFSDEVVCGLQHADDYPHSVNRPVLTELPWLALIGYKDKLGVSLPRNERYKCSGSLIDKRHVLTSAECLTLIDIIPSNVRLGEYDTGNETDCLGDSRIYECADAVQDFGIERVIVHPDYNKRNGKNNIGLIRLDKNVLYSDYIRPICLPSPERIKAQIGDTLVTSSWGKNEAETTEIKNIAFSTLITNKECKNYYKTNDVLFDGVMCGVPKNASGFCYGDLGSPVMFSNRWRWHQEGILSDIKECGSLFPEVYTRVGHYLNWIRKNLEP